MVDAIAHFHRLDKPPKNSTLALKPCDLLSNLKSRSEVIAKSNGRLFDNTIIILRGSIRSIEQLTEEILAFPRASRAILAEKLVESLEFDINSTVHKQENHLVQKRGNLSHLRGVAQSSPKSQEIDPDKDYTNYLTEKYR